MKVFISHSSKDQEDVEAFVALLEEGGVECWYSGRDIPAGIAYFEAIVPAIEEQCAVFLLWLSPDSAETKHVWREIDLADRASLRFLVINSGGMTPEDVPSAIRYFIVSPQWLEVSDPPTDAEVEEAVAALHDLGRLAAKPSDEDVTPSPRPAEPARPVRPSGFRSRLRRLTGWRRAPVYAASALVFGGVLLFAANYGNGGTPGGEAAVELKLRHFENLPYALHKTVTRHQLKTEQEALFYWVRVFVENRTDQRITAALNWEISSGHGQARVTEEKDEDFLVAGNSTKLVFADPGLELFSRDQDIDLVLKVTLYDPARPDEALDLKRAQFTIKKKNEFFWEWRRPLDNADTGFQDVDPKLKLAVLSVWSMDASPAIVTLRSSMRNAAGLSSLLKRAKLSPQTRTVRAAYRQIFAGSGRGSGSADPVRVTARYDGFPDTGRLRFPLDVWSDRADASKPINPLEAALLLSAVAGEPLSDSNGRLIILADSDGGYRRFFVAWSGPDGVWQGIDIDRTDLSFEDNLSRSSAQVAQLMADQTIDRSITASGVHYGPQGALIALDPLRAARHFKLSALR